MTTPGANAPPTSLYVGNLDPRVYRELLSEVFSLSSPVAQCHIVFDKATGLSSGFGFVEFADHASAQAAMDKFRGRSIYGKVLTIDWARATTRDASGKLEDPSSQYCLFVGNISPDVTDEQLMVAFSEFGTCTSAKCAKDPVTNKPQGFAFVSFRERAHAAAAMEALNGQVLNNRPLRVDWSKGKTSVATRAASMGFPDVAVGAPRADAMGRADADRSQLTFETIVNQTTHNNITAYVAGLKVTTSEAQIRDIFSQFGEIREIRIPESVKAQATETMYAFVRYLEHNAAAKAIFECQGGIEVDGRMVQVHWGRENVRRAPMQAMARGHVMPAYPGQPIAPHPYHTHYPPQPYGQRPPNTAQSYGRASAPGPMFQQSHMAAQHRYRPY